MMTPLKVILGFCFMMCIATGYAQKISTLDIVSIKQQYEKEALFFYEQNWKIFREEALNRKYISGYQLLRTPTDSIGRFHLILITEYPDSLNFQQAEHHFQPIMKTLRPDGPKMLNAVQRKEFLEYVTGYEGVLLFDGSANPGRE